VEFPVVTQARASVDYAPGNDQWRPLGVTGVLTYALGLGASKDSFRSTPKQFGNPKYPTKSEPRNRLQAAVLSLSKGPVTFADTINMTDRALIMKSCRSDGVLLSPSAPAVMLDSCLRDAAFGSRPAEQVSPHFHFHEL